MPPLRIDLHPDAVNEAAAAREWYAERSPAAALAFQVAVDEAIARIAEAPQRWPVYLGNTRRYLMHRFPYLVIYQTTDEAIQVLAIAHAKRKPGYWRNRRWPDDDSASRTQSRSALRLLAQ